MPEYTEHSQSGQPSTAMTAYDRLVRRYLHEDNRHIWLSCCVAVSSFAFFPLCSLVARRTPRLATTGWGRAVWSDKEGIKLLLQLSIGSGGLVYWHARWRQIDRMEEKDEDFRTIIERARLANKYRLELTSLWSVAKTGSVPADNLDNSVGIIEKICMTAAKLWTSPTRLLVMRKTFGDDLRKHGVSQSDIERTVILFGGAPDWYKHVFVQRLLTSAFWAGLAWPTFTERPRPRWLGPNIAAPAMVFMFSLIQFQHLWIALHIQNRSAVAAVLKESLLH